MSPLDDEPEDDPYKHVTEDSANIPPGMIFSVCRISGHYIVWNIRAKEVFFDMCCVLCRVGCGFKAVGCDFQCQSVDCIDTSGVPVLVY